MQKMIEKTFRSILPAAQEPWFENLISGMRTDQPKFQSVMEDENTRALYQHIIAADDGTIFKNIRREATQVLIKNVILKYLHEVMECNALPDTLAFALAPATIMVWAEIDDDNEVLEDNILLAEANTNAYARQFDLGIETLVVEKSDLLRIPSHYIEIKRSTFL
jgi:hypothetical protein